MLNLDASEQVLLNTWYAHGCLLETALEVNWHKGAVCTLLLPSS